MSRVIENPTELILSVAKKLASDEGLTGINMRTVAKECDIALGTIYNYYPTKMDLIIAIVESFWAECFSSLHTSYTQDLDFFQQLEYLYFYILKYLEQFKTNWLNDLSSLSTIHKQKGKQKEDEYMSHFIDLFTRLFQAHKHEFDPSLFNTFTQDELTHFIFSNFMMMLKNGDPNYEFFNSLLKRILISKGA